MTSSRESRGNNKTLIRNETPIEEEPGQDKRPNHSLFDARAIQTSLHTNVSTVSMNYFQIVVNVIYIVFGWYYRFT